MSETEVKLSKAIKANDGYAIKQVLDSMNLDEIINQSEKTLVSAGAHLNKDILAAIKSRGNLSIEARQKISQFIQDAQNNPDFTQEQREAHEWLTMSTEGRRFTKPKPTI